MWTFEYRAAAEARSVRRQHGFHTEGGIIQLLMLLAVPLFTWAGVACLIGIRRFHYPPLAIPAIGYLSWVVSFLFFNLDEPLR